MEITQELYSELKSKADKWDALEEKVTACYGKEGPNGEWIENTESDLCTIGEIAAMAFNFL